MTMTPYIFLTSNYLKYTQDSNAEAIDVRSLSVELPYTVDLYFCDMYGNIINRSIDTLALQNTNVKNMTVEAANSGGTFSPLFSISGNTQSNIFVKNSVPTVTSLIRVTIPDDGTNPATVEIGGLGIYGFLCNLYALTDSNYKIDANEGNYRVLSGAYIHWADYKKWTAKIKMDNLPQAQFDLLTAQADLGEMTVVPYQDLEADAIYECAANREYSYGLDRKTGLFNLDLELQEL